MDQSQTGIHNTMGNAIMIQTIVFELAFYMIIFLLGFDFSLSGFLVLKRDIKSFEKPKLLGLLIMSVVYRAFPMQKKRPVIYRPKVMGLYFFFGGILSVVASTIMIIGKLLGIT